MLLKWLFSIFLLVLCLQEFASADCPAECCCINGGNNVTNAKGCCQCQCPDDYTGDYCEINSVTRQIAKYTYFQGTNKYWYLTLSSEDPGHPIRKTLKRKRQNDPFDNFGGFKKGDDNPVFTLLFRGVGRTKLHFLEGEVRARRSNQQMTVTAYDGSAQVFTKTIDLINPGGYQHWNISFNDIFVTKVEFTFSSPCDYDDCYGINDIFGSFTRLVQEPLTCESMDCPDNGVATLDYGCCKCPFVCKNKLDVVLIIDRSGSIRSQYSMLKRVVKDIIHRFNVNSTDDSTHIGAVLYNNKVMVSFHLDELSTFAQYEDAVDNFPKARGSTNIAGALERTRKEELVAPGDRPGVPNACLLITDGKPNIRTNETKTEADLLKAHCTLVTVGVGKNIDESLLTSIATNGEYIHSNDVAELEKLLNRLITLLCSSTAT